ncbi:MAG: CheY-like chemotaxis protein [Paracoccaceae bacterium]|jgi:CheY-like chemotaxis protein
MTHHPPNRILVVEDDPLSAFMMHELLGTFGIEVTTVSSGAECLRLLTARPNSFGMVLMDIHMPGQSGDDIARCIQTYNAGRLGTLPVVAVTADVTWSCANRRHDVGLDDYLPKPVDADALQALCHRYGFSTKYHPPHKKDFHT